MLTRIRVTRAAHGELHSSPERLMMSYIRVMLRGTLPNGEVWSVNPAYNETTDAPSWDQGRGNAAAAAIGALLPPVDLRALASSAAVLASVRIERRSDGGTLIGAAEAGYSAGWAAAGSASKPAQTSCVISLRSTTPGASGRGRLYWPALGSTLAAATLRLSSPTPAAVAEAARSYLDSIETALKNNLQPAGSLIDYTLCVVSPTTSQRHDISRIEVGDILDVQRRRRDKMVETRNSVNYP